MGGHVHAGNVLVFPSGDWYGQVNDPAKAQPCCQSSGHVVQKAPRASPQLVLVQRAVGVAPFLQLGGLQDFVLAFVRDFTLDCHAEQPLEDVEGRAALGVFAIFEALGEMNANENENECVAVMQLIG